MSDSSGDKVSVLGVQSAQNPTQTDSEVLGLEDSPAIINSRKYIELIRDALTLIEKIDSTNGQVKEKVDNSLFFAKLNKSNKLPYSETLKFTQDSKILLDYLKNMENLSIKAAASGYEIGVAISESVMRNADEQSITKLEGKIADLKGLKKDAEKMDVSKLPTKIQAEHAEFIKSFDDVDKVFSEILDALKQKDAVALRSALLSMMSEGDSNVQIGTTFYVSFWQEDETLRSVEKIKDIWKAYKTAISK